MGNRLLYMAEPHYIYFAAVLDEPIGLLT